MKSRFTSLAAAQQMGYCPNFDAQAFDGFKTKSSIVKSFPSERTALEWLSSNPKPLAAKRTKSEIKFLIA